MRHSDPPKDKILQKNPLFLLRRSRPAALAGLALAAMAAACDEPRPETTQRWRECPACDTARLNTSCRDLVTSLTETTGRAESMLL